MIKKASQQKPIGSTGLIAPSAAPQVSPIQAKIDVVRQDVPEQANAAVSSDTVELYAESAISMLHRETSQMDIGAYETVAVTLPIRAFGLLSYYVIVCDDNFSLGHHVQQIDTTLRLAKIIVTNQTSMLRKFVISWV